MAEVIEIVQATTVEHFAQFQELVDEFMAWDSAMSREIGLNVDAVPTFSRRGPRLTSQPNTLERSRVPGDV